MQIHGIAQQFRRRVELAEAANRWIVPCQIGRSGPTKLDRHESATGKRATSWEGELQPSHRRSGGGGGGSGGSSGGGSGGCCCCCGGGGCIRHGAETVQRQHLADCDPPSPVALRPNGTPVGAELAGLGPATRPVYAPGVHAAAAWSDTLAAHTQVWTSHSRGVLSHFLHPSHSAVLVSVRRRPNPPAATRATVVRKQIWAISRLRVLTYGRRR